MSKLVRVHCHKCGVRLADTIPGARQLCRSCGAVTVALDRGGKGEPVKEEVRETRKQATAPRDPQPCLCGCGGMVKGRKRRFLQGHDAKLHSILLKVERGQLPVEAVPEIAKDHLMTCTGCGKPVMRHESGLGPICRKAMAVEAGASA